MWFGVDMNCERLTDMHMRQLRLLEIGDDIDLVRDREEQRLTGSMKLPNCTLRLATVAADGRRFWCTTD
jgi:hypothetical protein